MKHKKLVPTMKLFKLFVLPSHFDRITDTNADV